MRSAGNIKKLWAAAVLFATMVVLGVGAYGAMGDRWAVPNGASGSSWRVLSPQSSEVVAQSAYNNDLIPGATNSYKIGSPSKLVKSLAASRVTLGTNTTTANVTLTTSSAGVIFCSNATAVVTLQNATTAGAGFTQKVVNTAGSGNVSVASSSLVNGAASVNVTLNTGGEFVSTGSTWWRVY